MPDITMLGRTEGEILFVYHLAWNHGVHLEFNRGKYGNTENFMHCGISIEKELSKLMDHLLRPLIREMRTERMEETAGESVNNLPSEIKKKLSQIYMEENDISFGGNRRREACENHMPLSVFCVIRYSVRDIQQPRFSDV